MHSSLVLFTTVGILLQGAIAAPRLTPVGKRALTEVSIAVSVVTAVVGGVTSKLVPSAILSELKAITPTATPTNLSQAKSYISKAYASSTPTGWFDAAATALYNDMITTDLTDLIASLDTGDNNPNNVNTKAPSSTIYPKKNSKDPSYNQTEAVMRAQIYIPSTFTYGKKTPLLMVPGTGGRGGQNFQGNFRPLFSNVSYADPVWINPPLFQNADAQLNSETVAYAINYISSISQNKQVNVVAWSQGNLNVQWATKYWKSVRNTVGDHIAISPDYHGTDLADLIDPLNAVPLPPALLQQKYNSKYVTALRSNGGDSAYVPTTNIYSGFYDEIVEPQQNPNASAILKDAHKVGVTNAEVQVVCGADSPAAFFETHESMLANPLSYALAVDALTHSGPGLLSRIDLTTVCQQAIAPGLNFADFVLTEEDIVISAITILTYPSPVLVEPPLLPYATEVPPS